MTVCVLERKPWSCYFLEMLFFYLESLLPVKYTTADNLWSALKAVSSAWILCTKIGLEAWGYKIDFLSTQVILCSSWELWTIAQTFDCITLRLLTEFSCIQLLRTDHPSHVLSVRPFTSSLCSSPGTLCSKDTLTLLWCVTAEILLLTSFVWWPLGGSAMQKELALTLLALRNAALPEGSSTSASL